MYQKKIRYPLEMKDGIEVRNLKELQDNFDLDAVVRYYYSGKLVEWLNLWRLFDEEEKVKKISPRSKEQDIRRQLCEVFGIEYHPVPKVDPKESAWRAGRMNLLKRATDDPKYLSKLDQVAFSTEDVYDLLDQGVREIYLCGDNKFVFPAEIFREGEQSYYGIGKVTVTIESDEAIDFEGMKIKFENIDFDEAYMKLLYEQSLKRFKNLYSNEQAKRNMNKPAKKDK